MRNPRSLALAFAVVAGGVALGSVLGAAADPEMKNLPEPAWPAEPAVEAAAPEDAWAYAPAPYPERYAPAFPDEAITDWAPDYPAWTYSDFGSDVGENFDGEFGDDSAQASTRDRTVASEPGPPPQTSRLPAEPRLAEGLDALY